MGVRTSYAFVLFMAGSLCITAQHANFHANFKVFGFESGLGNLSVESVVQDHQGFLWVATEGGLFRYDGEKFESAGDGLGLPEYWPRGLHCSHDGWLWVGTPKGLYVKRGAHFKAVPIAGVAEIRGREAIDSDASGRVYVATPVSYTHLDVYKRQLRLLCADESGNRGPADVLPESTAIPRGGGAQRLSLIHI